MVQKSRPAFKTVVSSSSRLSFWSAKNVAKVISAGMNQDFLVCSVVEMFYSCCYCCIQPLSAFSPMVDRKGAWPVNKPALSIPKLCSLDIRPNLR